MSLPISSDLLTMKFVLGGKPFTHTLVTLSESDMVKNYGFILAAMPFTAPDSAVSIIFDGEGELEFDPSLIWGVDAEIEIILDTTAVQFLDLGPAEIEIELDVDGVLILPLQFNLNMSTLLQTNSLIDSEYGTKLGTQGYINSFPSVDISILENYLLPFTSVTAVGNIFEPTIILNGSYLVQNAATDPGGDISQTSLYINIKNAGLTGITACDLEGYSFTLDESGGNFNIVSSKTMGQLGATIDLYGFLGTITSTGQSLSNGQAGFTHRGIFGTPKLNRFFQYLMSANTTMIPLLTNPSFLFPGANSWQSAKSIAQAIASTVGIELQWTVFDVPVSDFRIEANMTALDALSSMASRAGARLRWNGNNKYLICYPDQFFGYWTPPACSLISSEGLSNENFLDLTTGIFGINQSILPAFNSRFEAGEKVIESTQLTPGASPQVQQVAKVKQKLESVDPPLIFDLPFDYDKVYIQILVSTAGETGGSNQVSIQNFVTRDPKEFFGMDVLGFANEYVFMTNVGGAFIPQVKVDYKLFPSPNSSIDANNFVLTIACTRKQLAASAPISNSQQDAAQGMAQEYYRFIKVYSGTFSCVFFGSIPVPGMWASATIPNVRLRIPNNLGGYDTITIGDVTVEGVIESVNFSFPGFITVSVAQYKRLRYSEVPRIDYGNNP